MSKFFYFMRLLMVGCLFSSVIRAADLGEPCDEFMDYDNALMRDTAKPSWRDPLDGELVTLENEYAKVVVWPDAGGAITEYVNKKTGTNYVAGKVIPGTTGYGWKEVTRLASQDPVSQWIGSLRHRVRQVKTPIGPGIEVSRRFGDLESRRLIVLDPHSAKLTITLHLKNVGDTPHRLFPRWHPYMMVGDPFAESSGIFLPDKDKNIRQIKVGIGWDDSFLDPGGYVMAANWKTGEGLWMTYDPRKVPLLTTWTDYKRGVRHPMRGAFTVEPWMMPQVKKPGEAVEITYVYFPFSTETELKEFPTDELPDTAMREEAQRFVRLVKPHLAMLGEYTMVPAQDTAESAVDENRFYFVHRRRDRMALREWGTADALFSMPGLQSMKARVRFFGKLFPEDKQAVDLRFVFFVEDALHHRVLEKSDQVTLWPGEAECDLRREYELGSLHDGYYTVGVEVFESGQKLPIHRVVESRKIVGEKRAELAKAQQVQAPERPFVTALRNIDFESDPSKMRIPIGIEEASGIARKQWPVFVGVPFAKGALRPETPLRLLTPDGREVGYDRSVSGTWDDGSVRWLLLRFAADLPASGHVFYQLAAGSSLSNTPPLLLAMEGQTIKFDNGNSKWEWKDEEHLGPLEGRGLWWDDAHGRRYEFKLKGEGAGLEIEQNGSYRAVVRATGWYYADGVEKPIARGVIRFEAYRGQDFLRIYHNVMFAGDPWHESLGSCGLEFPLPERKPGPVGIDLDEHTVEVNGGFKLIQSQENVCKLEAGGITTDGQRAGGVFFFPTATGTRTVVFRNLWKMFPKEVALAGDDARKVVFSYWPASSGVMSFLPREDGWLPSSSSGEAVATGMSRTQEFVLVDGPEQNLQKVEATFDEPIIAIVPPKYLATTGVMMHLQPYDPERSPELEKAINETFDAYLLNQKVWGWYGQWIYGALPNLFLPLEYRWADFGRYAHILNEEDIVQTPWLAFMRSGDRKYFKFAEANTRQLMEVSTINWSDIWPEDIGLSRRHHECPWLSSGDYGHSMLDPFLEMYRMTGYQPAWDAALSMAEAMKRQKSGDAGWRYLSNPLAGLSRMYLETQDLSYLREANRIWKDLCYPDRNTWWLMDHGDRAIMYFSQLNPEAKQIWLDWAVNKPDRFAGMDAMSALYLSTAEPKYAEAVSTAFANADAQRTRGILFSTDPILHGLGSITQSILTATRQMCYTGSTLEASKKLILEGKIKPPAVKEGHSEAPSD